MVVDCININNTKLLAEFFIIVLGYNLNTRQIKLFGKKRSIVKIAN